MSTVPLQSTQKFAVFSPGGGAAAAGLPMPPGAGVAAVGAAAFHGEQRSVPRAAVEGEGAESVAVVGIGAQQSRDVSLAELWQVAMGKARVEVIFPEEVKWQEGSEAEQDDEDKGEEETTVGEFDEAQVCSPPLAAAALFTKLVGLVKNPTAAPAELLVHLSDMLNAGILPAFSAAATCAPLDDTGRVLVTVLCGSDGAMCVTPQTGELVPAAEMYAATGITPLRRLSRTDRDAIQMAGGNFVATAAACMAACGARELCNLADIVAACTVEAAKGFTAPFDGELFEVCRPQRGQSSSATNLRQMLEGSQSVSMRLAAATAASNTVAEQVLRTISSDALSGVAFRAVPQVHGPLRDTVAPCARIATTELNAASDAGAADLRNAVGAFHPQQALAVLDQLRSAVLAVAELAEQRAQAIGNAPAVASVQTLWRNEPCFVAIGRTTAALGREFQWSIGSLLAEAAASGGVSGDGADGADAAAAQQPAKTAAEEEAEKRIAADRAARDAQLDEKTRARVEAKRRAKEEKARAKAAKKARNREKRGQIALGNGTKQVLQWLNKADVTSPEALADCAQLWSPTSVQFMSGCANPLIDALASGGVRRRPKIAKGARDFMPEQMQVREQAFSIVRNVFKRHGAVEIDTPVFELKETLTGKYGEDSKLIYDLADQGGELLSLRYDLTVPFARFLAMHSVGNIKRYHIGKVYRRDQPQISRGRYREFYQCDFDVAGNYSHMVADAEVVTVATEILANLPIGDFQVKLNHRVLLDAIFDICGVPSELFRPICSAVDKLDKEPWEEVRREMTEDKGLDPEVADRIGTFVCLSGSPRELHARLVEEQTFGDNPQAADAMHDLDVLFSYLEGLGSLRYVSFDLSLARGLDYYTGLIYEAVILDSGSSIGSIAAGGRYDNLVGMFSASGQQVPCVGVSIGIERVFTIMEQRAAAAGASNPSTVQVLVCSIGKGMMAHRMRVAKMLWDADIAAEFPQQDRPKLRPQLDEANERNIPFAVIFGNDELKAGTVNLKNLVDHTEEAVQLTDCVQALKNAGCCTVSDDTRVLDAIQAHMREEQQEAGLTVDGTGAGAAAPTGGDWAVVSSADTPTDNTNA